MNYHLTISMNKTIKYHLITYGCQMNISDSERIATILGLLNYQSVNNYHLANLIIINMCSVRQSAVDRVYGKIRQIKKDNPKAKIMLTGCILKTD
ncbi:MAG: tRNA (N6-isopentenyl adenosine(37)-C2)-methylthiotransferase MiaB, partial [Candidatus Aenigmarchaeota archaeon]|nr:tRNA (N6-isopentenyl adenosine(37)-C2)-methylthiotransferase MiaB [Candidatus Aenigmarchaeota archaeon]